ncbi:MAG TPA: ATP-binding protein [Candidatus Sulfotelmatobacter sp.]|jgi:signal transduction histidine kinase|nr:ATP-binding protein [Candidatus Sulfotelmatobacter sp.]
MRLFPETLVGRTVLVLILGLILSQLAMIGVFSLNHRDLTTRLGVQQMAERIAQSVLIVNKAANPQRVDTVMTLGDPGFRLGWGSDPVVRDDMVGSMSVEREGEEMKEALSTHLPQRDILVAELSRRRDGSIIDGEISGPGPGPGFVAPEGHRELMVAVKLDDGSWLNFVTHMAPHEPFLRVPFLGPLLGSLLVLLVLSVAAVRRAAKPLAVMEAAAQRLGRDVYAPPVPVSGPREVRSAAAAFNEMQTRLRRFIDDRTQMVAAISHDLRTPITRLKLRAEFIDDDEQRAKVLADLDEMEAMIASTLAFARDDATREMRQPFDLAEMLRDLCGEFSANYEGPDNLPVTAGPLSVKRTFANLLGNAKKYAGSACLTLGLRGDDHVVVVIDDDGPGIPETEMERVFAPFYRVEASRNRETGGTGLGLAVARSAIRAHGGDIHLANRPEGGLRITVVMPV